MTAASELYLLMVVGVFVIFSAVLAYVSWLQSQRGPDMITDASHGQASHDHAGHGHAQAA